MSDGDLVAGRSVGASQPGSIFGGVVVGSVLLVGLLMVGSPTTGDVIATVASSAFYAVVWGGATGIFVRHQWSRLPPPPVTHQVESPRLSGLVRGIVDAAFVGAAGTAAAYATSWLIGGGADISESRTVLGLLSGGLFGLSISTAIGARELRRWQNHHGVRLHTRVGPPRFAWTRAQAVQRLVAVPLSTGTR